MSKSSLTTARSGILSNDHSAAECWHPHYHASPFKERSAEIFHRWHEREYADNQCINIRRAAPLCIFGGVSYSPHVLDEHASGTHAVCPSCENVIGCGYDDETGLGPSECDRCNARLGLNDYFQPIYAGSSTTESDFVEPDRDPAVTIAEACSLVQQGIPAGVLAAVVAVMRDEGLLVTGSFVDDLLIRHGRVESRALERRLTGRVSTWTFIDSTAIRWNVKLTSRGAVMLKAREITALPNAQERIKKLLSLDDKVLRAIAWKALANQVLKDRSVAEVVAE